jgi:prepilin-type processing-associated H-X9-DG protein
VAARPAQFTQPICYCVGCGFLPSDFLAQWNEFMSTPPQPTDYRVIGYALTFPGTATVEATNQNPSLLPQAITDSRTGVTFPPPSPSDRVLMADAIISQPGDTDEVHRWLNVYINIKGAYPKPHRTAHLLGGSAMPSGGNVGMLDGHVEWRKFDQMHVRTDPASSTPVFWW